MPLYEYQCEKCGSVADVRHGFDETPALTCEKCDGPMARQFSAAGIVFKGSGFYKTDSRKPSTEAKSETKSESSPAPAATPAKTETPAA